MYLHEICSYIKSATGFGMSGSTVCQILQRNGYTRNKVQVIALEKSIHYRSIFQANISHFCADHCVWVDKTGTDSRNHVCVSSGTV